MSHFDVTDEKNHPADANKYWNESYYLNFFDLDDKWAGACRIAFSPNQGLADGFLILYFPGGGGGFIRVREDCPDHLGRFSVKSMEHVCDDPFKRWTVRYKGPIFYFEKPEIMGDFMQTMLTDLPRKQIELEIEFNAIHDVFDFHDSMKKEFISFAELLKKLKPSYFFNHLGPAMRKIMLVRTMSRAQHYEHAGAIKGSITVDGRPHRFEGFGQRDHSWGVRDMRVPSNWRWFSGQFGSELCFNAIKVEILALRASGGYVFHEGVAEAIAHWEYMADYAESGRWAKNIILLITTVSGNNFEINARADVNIPVIVNTGGLVGEVNEARATMTWEGKKGFGISEFMGQLY